MTKKDFILLADYIRESNTYGMMDLPYFNERHLDTLATFCKATNPNFNRSRWLGYINGTNGPNGGKIK